MSETTKEHRDCLAKGFPFWNDLTPDEQDMLCRYTRPVHYAKGARVHSPLESCVGILLLRSGQLRSYLLSEDGRDVTLYRLFGGEVCILSASCVMDAVNIDLYIDAEEDTEALCISAGIFRQLMQENVYVRCYAYQMTAERFSDTMWTMQQILFMSADRRLAIFLTDELAKTGGADVRMTHDQMAKYMGSAREVVSRMLKYFAQEGWVRLYRGGVQGIMFFLVRGVLGIWSLVAVAGLGVETPAGFVTAGIIMCGFLLVSLVVGVIWCPNTQGRTLDEITEERYGKHID